MIKRSIASSVTWSFLGQLIPLLVAIGTVPILIHRMGTARFGLLAFIWLVVGYSSMLDLGIGKALTQGVADRLGRGLLNEIPPIIRVGLALLFAVALLLSVILYVLSRWIANHFLKLPIGLIADAESGISLLSIAVPLLIVGAAFRGILEAYQRFKEISLIRASAGVLLYLSPLLTLEFTSSIRAIVWGLVAVRLFELLALGALSASTVPGIFQSTEIPRIHVRELVTFGLWSTVNNLVGSLMSLAYIDRLLISSLLGTSALAFYSTPFDLVVRVLIFPAAITGVLFPVLSNYDLSTSANAEKLAARATRIILFLTAPIFLLFIGSARVLLRFWLGGHFAERSAQNLQLFAIGALAISMAYVPFTFVQAACRPDLTAKRHLWELPVYLLASFLSIRSFGLLGAGLVWCVWAIIDLILMTKIFRREFGLATRGRAPISWIPAMALFSVTFVASTLGGSLVQLVAGLVGPTVCGWLGWRFWLQPADRSILLRYLPKFSLRSVSQRWTGE